MRACLVFVEILLGALKGILPTTYRHDALEMLLVGSELLPVAELKVRFKQHILMSSFRKGESSSLFTHPAGMRKF